MIITLSLLLLMFAHKRKQSGVGRVKYFGGNSGYVNYSMSRRAAEARKAGRFPKTDFRSYYNVTPKSFEMLIGLDIINGDEWHHTSKYGNRTNFYSWAEPEYRQWYEDNKTLIDKMARGNDVEGVKILLEPVESAIEARIEEAHQKWERHWERLKAAEEERKNKQS